MVTQFKSQSSITCFFRQLITQLHWTNSWCSHAFSKSSFIPSYIIKTSTNIKNYSYNKLDDHAPWCFAKTMFHSTSIGFIDIFSLNYFFLIFTFILTAFKKAKADRRWCGLWHWIPLLPVRPDKLQTEGVYTHSNSRDSCRCLWEASKRDHKWGYIWA